MSLSRPGKVSRKTDWPIISAAVYPKVRSAAAFQLVTVPSNPVLMMASSEKWTIAAKDQRPLFDVTQLQFSPPALCNIGDRRQDDCAVLGRDRVYADLDRKCCAIFFYAAKIASRIDGPGHVIGKEPRACTDGDLAATLRYQQLDRPTDQFRSRVPEDPSGLSVDHQDSASLIGHDHGIWRKLENELKPPFSRRFGADKLLAVGKARVAVHFVLVSSTSGLGRSAVGRHSTFDGGQRAGERKSGEITSPPGITLYTPRKKP